MPASLNDLLELMRQLRAPGGCPWDREQTLQSLVKHTLEEAYEVVDVVERSAHGELKAELGDLLFQVVFYAQIATEMGAFDFTEVIDTLHEKLTRRHPHVFGSEPITSAPATTLRWETLKAAERTARAMGRPASELDNVPLALPALTRAAKLQKRAARVGFDWQSIGPVFAKVREELVELESAIADSAAVDHLTEELGDILFASVNLGRHLGLDPEGALRAANRKFERRFHYIESELAATGARIDDADLAAMDALWEAAKRAGL
ncbi:MAG: nucleoside triphosphate pyrophosphohydrolase [Gammaproteobacteria bacterium]|nr:nucleoside triphosphate pyrophosphohydrolase [Gammaproteobacteria bacterium]